MALCEMGALTPHGWPYSRAYMHLVPARGCPWKCNEPVGTQSARCSLMYMQTNIYIPTTQRIKDSARIFICTSIQGGTSRCKSFIVHSNKMQDMTISIATKQLKLNAIKRTAPPHTTPQIHFIGQSRRIDLRVVRGALNIYQRRKFIQWTDSVGYSTSGGRHYFI